MRFPGAVLTGLLTLLLFLGGCSLVEGEAGGVKSYAVKGRVTDESGAPLAGVDVFAENTAGYGARVAGATDDEGLYELDLEGREPSSWRVSAQLSREYHGTKYTFSLYPRETAQFAGEKGAIRDFEWKLSGANPAGGVYGYPVYVYADAAAPDLDPSKVVLTFTPDGSLVDGSDGKSFSMVPKDGTTIPDVPVGRYTVTAASSTDTGSGIRLRIPGKGEFTDKVTADFAETEEHGIAMELEISS